MQRPRTPWGRTYFVFSQEETMQTDPTTGDNPILDNGPQIEINGDTYTVRRLGVKDTFTLARILAAGALAVGQERLIETGGTPDQLAQVLLAGVVAVENIAIDFLASVINVKRRDFENPELFPMGAEIQIIEALVTHVDVKSFFAHAQALATKLPETLTRSPAAST